MTQAARLISAIRAAGPAGLTYGELQDLHISTSPQKRLEEAGSRYLTEGEELQHKRGPDGLVRFVITQAAVA